MSAQRKRRGALVLPFVPRAQSNAEGQRNKDLYFGFERAIAAATEAVGTPEADVRVTAAEAAGLELEKHLATCAAEQRLTGVGFYVMRSRVPSMWAEWNAARCRADRMRSGAPVVDLAAARAEQA